MPVTKAVNDAVIGGTVNQEGMVWVKPTNVGSDTVLSNIIKLVEEAQLAKPSIQVFADKVSGYFVPFVLAVAFLSFTIWFSLALSGVLPSGWIPAGQNSFLFAFLFGYLGNSW